MMSQHPGESGGMQWDMRCSSPNLLLCQMTAVWSWDMHFRFEGCIRSGVTRRVSKFAHKGISAWTRIRMHGNN